jgi:hypothetical protein
VDFGVGLTVISGASDTGKTYIANTVDFLLGASSPPPDNPQSRKYNRALLGIQTTCSPITVERDFRESVVQVYEAPLDSLNEQTQKKQMAASLRGNPSESLSQYLLSLIGLGDKLIRKNQYGEKSALSLRHIAHLTVVSEERIISKTSPVLSGDTMSAPLERAIFSFFLTGMDDAELTVVEKPKDKKARLNAEEGVVQSILQKKQESFSKIMGDDADVKGRLAKIEGAIAQATVLLSATQSQIETLEADRKALWTQLQKIKSRNLFIAEQLKRFALLEEFYNTDHRRLESIIEAGRAFETLPGGECAVCGSKLNERPSTPTEEFLTACGSELAKLQQLATELRVALKDLVDEQERNLTAIQTLEGKLSESQRQIDNTLQPQSSRADVGLGELIRLKTEVSKALEIQVEIGELEKRIQEIDGARKQKIPKSNGISNIGTARAAKFCAVVQEILQSWKYPLNGNVAFDPEAQKFDIVIGDQDRGSMGKGYRAITHAAFLIGLMRYCRREGIPHPGFVLLDTPLNPFKGPDDGQGGTVNDEVKNAFFEALAADTSGDQVIVLENTEPPASVISKICYHHFSKNTSTGRYGFFPL